MGATTYVPSLLYVASICCGFSVHVVHPHITLQVEGIDDEVQGRAISLLYALVRGGNVEVQANVFVRPDPTCHRTDPILPAIVLTRSYLPLY